MPKGGFFDMVEHPSILDDDDDDDDDDDVMDSAECENDLSPSG